MPDQKAENLLNLSWDATEAEREKSLNLNIGYNTEERTWDVIVKYNGEVTLLEDQATRVVPLFNRYAIVTATQERLEQILNEPQIEFMEMPKRLYFEVNNGRRVSCIETVQSGFFGQSLNLSGRGILVAVIDSGVDIKHPDFRNNDGSTRIVALWDQTGQNDDNPPPRGYVLGAYYDADAINRLLSASENGAAPAADISGHGTAVLGIAAGNGRQSNGVYRGVAYESPIIAVKLGNSREGGFPRTTELMQALNFVVEKALDMQMPVAVNLSFGNTYGSHNDNSLLEAYINDLASIWKSVIVVGSGNEGSAAGHTFGVMQVGRTEEIPLAVSSYEPTLNVQIWKQYFDKADIQIVSPGGSVAGPFQEILGPKRFILEGTELLLYYGKPGPYSILQEIYIDFLPTENYVTDGLWYIRLLPRRIIEGKFHLWLPAQGSLNRQTRFLYPAPDTTLTIPSTAGRVITVGAYNSLTDTYADFSGRGPNSFLGVQKPDISAPGVNIQTTKAGGGYAVFTGTSFAAPFVTGSAALLMQWGIVEGNDPFLYGEKVRAYLQSGARQLPGMGETPNALTGYGALCVRDSLPE